MASVFGDTDNPPVISRIDEQFAIDIANTTGLNITIVGGNVLSAGAVVFVEATALVLNDDATNYICIDSAVPEIVNDGAAVGAEHSVLYEIVTLNGAIVSCTDSRIVYFPAVSEGVSATAIYAATTAAASKATPVDADKLGLLDSVSATLKHLTWANLKATLKAYNDTLYAALAGSTSQTFSVAQFSAAEHAPRVAQPITAWTRAATTALGTTLSGTLSDTSTTITAFSGIAGVTYHCRALGAGSITHHATNLIITQTGASITTAAGDTFDVEMLTATTCRIKNYQRASGVALVTNSNITNATKQASTSGTSINFTSIPAGVKRITIMMDGVSLSGTDNLLVQVGDSGGLETSGYLGSCQGATVATYTAGFGITLGSASIVIHGAMTLTLMDASTNTWIAQTSFGRSDSAYVAVGGGSKSLSTTLDRVSILPSGANTFDAGNINISYEY